MLISRIAKSHRRDDKALADASAKKFNVPGDVNVTLFIEHESSLRPILVWRRGNVYLLRNSALATILAFVLANAGFAQDERMSPKLRANLQHSVEVRLSTDKETDDAGEAPLLSLEVENVGTLPVYMYPKARLGYDGNGVFRIYVKPERSCLMHGWGEHEDESPNNPTANLAKYIAKNWALVKPGDAIKLTEKLDISRLSLCPGRNTLSVNYFTKLQAWTPQQIKASGVELDYPAVYGSYDGNSVTITVKSDH
jgi:hypothetical protein